MVSLSQRLSRSGALTSACLHAHVGRALLFSFPCRSQRSHDISRLAQVKESSALCHTHTLPKLFRSKYSNGNQFVNVGREQMIEALKVVRKMQVDKDYNVRVRVCGAPLNYASKGYTWGKLNPCL